MRTIVNELLLILVFSMAALATGCADEMKPTDKETLETRLSEDGMQLLKRQLEGLSMSYALKEKNGANIDELEDRDVYFVNFYQDGKIVLTVHDLKGNGRITYYVYGQSFDSEASYQSFLRDVSEIFKAVE